MSVVVAGSINMDIVVTAGRFPMRGETIPGTGLRFSPGGKGANQAVAAARSGAVVRLLGCLGDDAFAQSLRAYLAAERIDLTQLRAAPGFPSGTAIVTVAEADNAIIVIPGANARVEAADLAQATLGSGDLLVSQFEIPVAFIAAFFARGRACGARTLLNPAPAMEVGRGLIDLVDILVLNETELAALGQAGIAHGAGPREVAAAARRLRSRSDQIVCVTLGARGVVCLAGDDVIALPARPVGVVDTTGAGDCFVGALAARLAAGSPLPAALHYANTAASLCVQRPGAGPSMPTRAEVEAALSGP
ncbi:MAG: ribokinase [Rhodospirillaceae bacterium]|nr:ribokinase [Rhodospirillaceae bacterium]